AARRAGIEAREQRNSVAAASLPASKFRSVSRMRTALDVEAIRCSYSGSFRLNWRMAVNRELDDSSLCVVRAQVSPSYSTETIETAALQLTARASEMPSRGHLEPVPGCPEPVPGCPEPIPGVIPIRPPTASARAAGERSSPAR